MSAPDWGEASSRQLRAATRKHYWEEKYREWRSVHEHRPAPVWVNETAGVNVTVGGSGGTTCVRRSPTVVASPAQQQGAAGATLSYTLSVTNTNTGCPAANYTVQSTAPSGWTAGTGPGALADAGATPVSIALGVTSGSSAAAGTYTVSARIFDAAAPAYWVSTNVLYQVANAGPVGAFSDDFNRADSSTLGNGWTLAKGGYAIQGGAAVGQVALNLAVKATVCASALRLKPEPDRFGARGVCPVDVGIRYQVRCGRALRGRERLLRVLPTGGRGVAVEDLQGGQRGREGAEGRVGYAGAHCDPLHGVVLGERERHLHR